MSGKLKKAKSLHSTIWNGQDAYFLCIKQKRQPGFKNLSASQETLREEEGAHHSSISCARDLSSGKPHRLCTSTLIHVSIRASISPAAPRASGNIILAKKAMAVNNREVTRSAKGEKSSSFISSSLTLIPEVTGRRQNLEKLDPLHFYSGLLSSG